MTAAAAMCAASLALVACTGGESGGADPPPEEIDGMQLEQDHVAAQIQYDLGGGDTAVVKVLGLQVVNADLMLLQLHVTPELSGNDSVSLYDMFGSTEPQIYDRVNLKRYSTYAGSESWRGGTANQAERGETIFWWGYFAVPDDEVDTLDVQLSPGRPLIEGVPVW